MLELSLDVDTVEGGGRMSVAEDETGIVVGSGEDVVIWDVEGSERSDASVSLLLSEKLPLLLTVGRVDNGSSGPRVRGLLDRMLLSEVVPEVISSDDALLSDNVESVPDDDISNVEDGESLFVDVAVFVGTMSTADELESSATTSCLKAKTRSSLPATCS